MATVRAIGAFLLEALKAFGLYLLIVVVGTGALMLIASSVGYGTYGDRPGTGWFGFHLNFSVDSLQFIGGFVIFTAYLAVLTLYVPALTLLVAGLRRLTIPRWVRCLILVPTVGLVTLYVLLAAGWYIAIDGYFVIAGTLLSAVFSIIASSGPTSSGRTFRPTNERPGS